MIVSELEPTAPEPSTYVPGQTAIVSPLAAAKIAFWIVEKPAAGHSTPSSSTVSVAARAAGAAASTPSAAITTAQALLVTSDQPPWQPSSTGTNPARPS